MFLAFKKRLALNLTSALSGSSFLKTLVLSKNLIIFPRYDRVSFRPPGTGSFGGVLSPAVHWESPGGTDSLQLSGHPLSTPRALPPTPHPATGH